MVDDVVYVFGGRGVDGKDLGDLGAFKLSSEPFFVSVAPKGELLTRSQTKDGTCSKKWDLRPLRAQVMPWLPWAHEYSYSAG